MSSGGSEEHVSPDSPAPGEAANNLPAALQEALSQPGVPAELVQMTVAAFAGFYAGPLPPAEQIRAYEQVLPGSADRILRMAERQQEHRMELERMTVHEAANRSWWGLRLGFVIAVLVVGIGAAAIFTGHALAGFGVLIGEAAILAGVFVYGRDQQRRERLEKENQTRPSLPGAERHGHDQQNLGALRDDASLSVISRPLTGCILGAWTCGGWHRIAARAVLRAPRHGWDARIDTLL